MFTPMRDASICVSNESAYYNNDRETKLQNELNNSQDVMMQSVNNNELDFDRGQHIPAFSFFGKVDYMAKDAEAKKSVSSVSALGASLPTPVKLRSRSPDLGGSDHKNNDLPLPTFNGQAPNKIEGGLYFLQDGRKPQKSEKYARPSLSLLNNEEFK